MLLDKEALKFFITEDIFLVENQKVETSVSTEKQESVENKKETGASSQDEIIIQRLEKVETKPSKDVEPAVSKVTNEADQNNKTDDVAPLQKPLLIVYQYDQAETLPPPLKQLMLNIIQAIGLEIKDIVFVNCSFLEVKDHLNKFHCFLLFGYDSDVYYDIIGHVMPYKVVTIESTKILKADKLEDIAEATLLKRRLWANLKEMFAKN